MRTQTVEAKPPQTLTDRLAHAAVHRYGDGAERYVSWLRATYPHATREGLVRAITERFARRPWYTALGGPAGLGALVATQAELVLHLAAVHGRDPRAPERAEELVRLIGPRGLAASAAVRMAGRTVPGAGLVLRLLADQGTLEGTVRRATAYYRAT